MKILDVKQNTWDWYRERLGRPTASEFDKIITPTGKASDTQLKYMYQLIFERIYKRQANAITPTKWMERGKVMEPEAKGEFEKMTGWKLREIGLVITDDGKFGCSPDATIWDNPHEGVEVKVPEPWKHIMYTVEGPLKDYKAQIQAQIWIAGFEKVHFFSYCPGMPCKVHTVYPDKTYIEAMSLLAPKFVQDLEEKEAKARALGNFFVAEEWNGRLQSI